jgi:release factor glutamine methyltransferase
LAPEPQSWTIGSLLKWATDDFRTRGIESPRLDAELLVGHALTLTRTEIIVQLDRPLMAGELAKLRDLVKRRRAREPIAYLRGHREFYGREFRVDKRVLIPRPDTEILVETALRRSAARSLSMRALDLCTGSGCVAITMARERPTARVYGIDISEDALAVARDNALRLGAYNAAFGRSDLFAGVDALAGAGVRFDVITANPPYIATEELQTLAPDIRDFEPRLALDGGQDGLAFFQRIAEGARERLEPHGVLAVEVGAGEAEAVEAIFEAAGYTHVERAKDYARIERVVSGLRG